jgi:conflict system STAND superfamily ATPase/TIR domain-containing protein
MPQSGPCRIAASYEHRRLFTFNLRGRLGHGIVTLRNVFQLPKSARLGLNLSRLFISHSSKDDLAAEAMRIHLVQRGWNRREIFLDFSVEGISAHEKWKASLADANSGANALLCLASPDWLASRESQVERRVAETFRDLDRQGSRAVLVAILRDLKLDDLRAEGFGEDQIVDLSGAGESTLIRAELPGRPGQPGRYDDVKLNTQALEKIERSLRLIGIAPENFEWHPRDPSRSSPYPGLEAFTENDAGVFFGRESRLADALGIIDRLRRRDGSRVFTIIAPSGVGKSSFLRAGLWPRLARQSGVAPLVVLRPGTGYVVMTRGRSLVGSRWPQRCTRTRNRSTRRSRPPARTTGRWMRFSVSRCASDRYRRTGIGFTALRGRMRVVVLRSYGQLRPV